METETEKQFLKEAKATLKNIILYILYIIYIIQYFLYTSFYQVDTLLQKNCFLFSVSNVFVLFFFLITFAASSSNTVFLWIHVLDLCVLLKIALFVRTERKVCFFTDFYKRFMVYSLCM